MLAVVSQDLADNVATRFTARGRALAKQITAWSETGKILNGTTGHRQELQGAAPYVLRPRPRSQLSLNLSHVLSLTTPFIRGPVGVDRRGPQLHRLRLCWFSR